MNNQPPANNEPPANPPIVVQILPPQPPAPAWQVQALNMGLSPDETVLYELMTNFHSFTQQQYVYLRDIGEYGTLRDLNQ